VQSGVTPVFLLPQSRAPFGAAPGREPISDRYRQKD